MPFSSPHSYVLDELARKQAQQALMQQQAQQNIGGAVGALKGLNDEMDRQKAHADVLAQQAKDNARADAASKREDLRFDEQKAQDAAANARADDELKLHHSADERAAAAAKRDDDEAHRAQLRFDTENETRATGAARDELVRVVAAGRAAGKTPKQIAAEAHDNPNLANITGDEEIEALWRAQEDAANDKTKGAADAAAKEADRIRHEKVDEAQGWARINASKENAAAKAGAGSAKLSPADEKRRSMVQEIETRKEAIKRNIASLKEIVKNTGTVEMFGPEAQQREQLLNEIATDMAKLADPNSVARPSEVEQARKGLLPQGRFDALITSDATAQKILDAAEKNADARAAEAYRIHGITPDASGQVGVPAPPPGGERSAPMNLDAMKPEDLANLSDDELNALLGRK